MVSSIEQLRKRLGPSWEPTDLSDLQILGILSPNFMKSVQNNLNLLLSIRVGPKFKQIRTAR